MNIFLLYNQFYSKAGDVRKIGGIETYMEYLAQLLSKEQYKVYIYQLSSCSFEKKLPFADVYGYPVKNMRKLFDIAQSKMNKSEDIVIFMSDVHSCKSKGVKTISIQHGIFWDIPYNSGNLIFNMIKRFRIILRSLRNFNKCGNSVCVDYNFYNWYKTLYVNKNISKKIWIIPNFSKNFLDIDIQAVENKDNQVKIIFARRFEEYRGALLFSNVMKKIMEKYPNVVLTIAGEGPCENQMKDILANFIERVSFIKYLPTDSFNIHKKHVIAVIPTIGSEGTSLSLLEAMGAGCIVVATPIGGMSNILIDEFNGIVAMPNEHSLYEKIDKAINLSDQQRIRLKRNSINTVKSGFSLNKWNSSWLEVIDCVKKQQ